jgi:uncharacterized SAM-binding protein YcdF (DUF218 family)
MAKKSFLLSHAMKLTFAVIGGAATLWLAGFLAFFVLVAGDQPRAPDEKTDVVVVLTGGTGRIEEGLRLMAEGRAKAMLVSGVHPDVSLRTLLDRWPGDARSKDRLTRHCCIYLEHQAATTEENAAETRGWLERNGGAKGVSVRLVTSDYHMPRARLLFRRALPETDLYSWPVKTTRMGTRAYWGTLLSEYTKTILTWLT